MEATLLKAFCLVKQGVKPKGLSASDITNINTFLTYRVYIEKGEFGILDANENKLAYCKGNTSTFRRGYRYIIYISYGEPYLYILSSINMPQCIKLNKKQPLCVQNTPNPTQLYNDNEVNYEHQVLFK